MKIIKEQMENMKKGDFSEKDIENEKRGIISYINTIEDEQDTQIMYYLGQEFLKYKDTIEEYKTGIKNVTKDKILEIANKVKINTVYFLKN